MITRYITTVADDFLQTFQYNPDDIYSLGKLVMKITLRICKIRSCCVFTAPKSSEWEHRRKERVLQYETQTVRVQNKDVFLYKDIVIEISVNYPGSKTNVDIFNESTEFYKLALENRQCEK